MPWHVEEDRQDCQGFAVIKDEDGSLVGCHRTEAQADRQLAALYASEENNRAVGDPPAIVTDIDVDARNPISNRSIAEQILAEIRDRG